MEMYNFCMKDYSLMMRISYGLWEEKKTNKRTCLISQWGSVPFGLIHNSSIMRLMEVLSISSLRAFIMEREGGKSVAGRAVGRDELGDWA